MCWEAEKLKHGVNTKIIHKGRFEKGYRKASGGKRDAIEHFIKKEISILNRTD